MRFSRLYLANWRNFAHVDVALEERMFLIGANATGKSNLLDAFRFLRDIVRIGGGFEKAILDRGGVSSLCSFFAQDNPDIVIDVHLANGKQEIWRYFLAITQDTQHRPLLQAEKVWRSGTLLLNRPDLQDAIDDRLLRQTHLEQINSNREFREIADFFNSITYYHIVPQLVREPERSVGRTSDPYGSDFIEQIANLPKRTQEARLRRIQSVLRTAIPQLAELRITKDRARVPHLLGKFSDQGTEGLWHTEADFSDGTLRLMGLLWALLDGTGPLLLEEPELSLHQEVVRQIPSIMWSLQKEHARQTLVSTHSYDLLRNEGIGADEILILRSTSHGTEVKLGVEIDTVRHLLEAGLTVGEAALPHTRPEGAETLS
jgi:predicted ATPase